MNAREVQRSDQLSDVSSQAEVMPDLSINELVYKRPLALSLATARSYNRNFFQRSAYSPGETAVIDFNSGTDFVDPLNSYIVFDMVLNGTTGALGFGIGSAMNLIRQVTIKTRSGTEIDRVERANIWSLYNTLYQNSPSALLGPGGLEGWGSSNSGFAAATSTRFVIPLKRLAPFFNPTNPRMKIPPQLMSGLHMEIIWEGPNSALFRGSGDATSYSIANLAIMTDNICMTDDTQKTLNEQSAMNGLEYTFPRVFWQAENVGLSTALNAQVRKAVTLGSIAWAVPLANATATIGVDDFKAVAWDVTRFQFRLGALYFPIQAIEGATSTLSAPESYAQALETFDRFRHPSSEPSVWLRNSAVATSMVVPVLFETGAGVLSASLEKDAALNASGLPLNNSRVLEISATHGSVDRTWNIFLEYMAVARSYIDNTNIAI